MVVSVGLSGPRLLQITVKKLLGGKTAAFARGILAKWQRRRNHRAYQKLVFLQKADGRTHTRLIYRATHVRILTAGSRGAVAAPRSITKPPLMLQLKSHILFRGYRWNLESRRWLGKPEPKSRMGAPGDGSSSALLFAVSRRLKRPRRRKVFQDGPITRLQMIALAPYGPQGKSGEKYGPSHRWERFRSQVPALQTGRGELQMGWLPRSGELRGKTLTLAPYGPQGKSGEKYGPSHRWERFRSQVPALQTGRGEPQMGWLPRSGELRGKTLTFLEIRSSSPGRKPALGRSWFSRRWSSSEKNSPAGMTMERPGRIGGIAGPVLSCLTQLLAGTGFKRLGSHAVVRAETGFSSRLPERLPVFPMDRVYPREEDSPMSPAATALFPHVATFYPNRRTSRSTVPPQSPRSFLGFGSNGSLHYRGTSYPGYGAIGPSLPAAVESAGNVAKRMAMYHRRAGNVAVKRSLMTQRVSLVRFEAQSEPWVRLSNLGRALLQVWRLKRSYRVFSPGEAAMDPPGFGWPMPGRHPVLQTNDAAPTRPASPGSTRLSVVRPVVAGAKAETGNQASTPAEARFARKGSEEGKQAGRRVSSGTGKREVDRPEASLNLLAGKVTSVIRDRIEVERQKRGRR